MTGVWPLVRLALRRDRVMIPAWVVALVGMSVTSVLGTVGLYPDEASRTASSAGINGAPSPVALYGRIYDPASLGALSMIKMDGLGTAFVAILGLLLVVRHTRAEEEAGRLELIGAGVVGRYAALTAALIVAVGTSLVLGVVTALSLIACGLPAAGSFAFGAAWMGAGIAFAGIGVLAAQLTRTPRSANAIGVVALGAVYLLRAVGDTRGPEWLSWLSPIGLSQQIRPFAGERWWVFLILAGIAAVFSAGAYVLHGHRDLGTGLLPDRAGRAHAGRLLHGPLGLAWRLHRGSIVGWAAAFLVLGAVCGSIAQNLGGLVNTPQTKALFEALGGEQGLTNAFIAAELSIGGIAAAVYGIQGAMRLHSEETSLHMESLLATGVSRVRWALSHIVVVAVGCTVLLVAMGLGAGLTDGRMLLGAALAQLPATLVLVGITVAAFGFVPRFSALGWAALVAFVLLGELGPLLRLSHWVMDLSPFTHLPKLPGGDITATPLVWLSVVAVGFAAAGLVAFRQRDMS
jgi:ABC-2 type transport system permease protein